MRNSIIGFVAIVFFGLAGIAAADSIYDESVDGDLSNDGFAPTLIDFLIGNNIVMGEVGPAAEDDFFTFTIEADETLNSILVVDYSSNSNQTFLGIEDAGIYDTPNNSFAFGFTFFTTTDIGTDLLPEMGASNGNFSAPLGPGTYSIWIDEGTGPEQYALNFQVSRVPEPSSTIIGLVGLAGLIGRRRQ